MGTSSDRPVISAGGEMPSRYKIVGATSARMPEFIRHEALSSSHVKDLNRKRRVGSEGFPQLVEQFFGVAVVGGHERDASNCSQRFEHSPHAGVDRFDRLDDGRDASRVPNHVRVRVIADHHVVLVRFESSHQFVGHACGAHFGLQIVRRPPSGIESMRDLRPRRAPPRRR